MLSCVFRPRGVCYLAYFVLGVCYFAYFVLGGGVTVRLSSWGCYRAYFVPGVCAIVRVEGCVILRIMRYY